MGDFFGTNPATPEEREAQIARSLRESQVDHIIKDGQVYLNAEEIASTYRHVSKLLVLRALLTGDDLSKGAAGGMDVAGKILADLSGELLRREADAIFKASEGN